MLRYLSLAVLLLLLAPKPSAQDTAPVDAAGLITAMHDRYADTWYRTLYFTQATSQVGPDGTVSEATWREWMALPGRLRIEMGDPEAGNGALFARDSTFIFREGAQMAARAERNDLLTLGFDVYGQAPEVTLAQMVADGFTLGPVRTETWEGRPAYVFGDADGKTVWIDAERLVFVRLTEPSPQNRALLQDIRFTDYAPLDGGWIAPTVEVWLGDQKVFWEVYSDIRTGFEADPTLFDPGDWGGPAPVPSE